MTICYIPNPAQYLNLTTTLLTINEWMNEWNWKTKLHLSEYNWCNVKYHSVDYHIFLPLMFCIKKTGHMYYIHKKQLVIFVNIANKSQYEVLSNLNILIY